MLFVLSVLFSIATQAAGQTAQPGQIEGAVVDSSDAAITGMEIRAYLASSKRISVQALTDGSGHFKLGPLASGQYTVKARGRGFGSRNVEAFVHTGEITGPLKIVLEVSCDAPHVNGDNFSNDPKDFPAEPLSSGQLKGDLNCVIDLGKDAVYCPGSAALSRHSRTADIKIVEHGGHTYLHPLNGSSIAPPNSAHADCSGAKFGRDDIAVAFIVPGDDLCVRTHAGYVSHLFVIDNFVSEEGEPAPPLFSFWQVTRK